VSRDQNFKSFILDYSRAALAQFAAAEAADFDPGARLLPIRQAQLQPRLWGRFRELDRGCSRNGRMVAAPAAPPFVLETGSDPRRCSIQCLAPFIDTDGGARSRR
jgi:hypothetical protein